MPYFRSDELQLFFTDTGPQASRDRDAPVLLIHGFASTHVVNWVNPSWTRTLGEAGYRVVAIDNRGHGASDKPHDVAAYRPAAMAGDVLALLDHLRLPDAHLMGYSMGARIAAFAASAAPKRAKTVVLGGLGEHLVDGGGLPDSIRDAMTAPDLAAVMDPDGRLFRRFAEANGSDLQALAACIEGSRQNVSPEQLRALVMPVLVAVGTRDAIAGDARRLAAMLPRGEALDIPDRDHNLAVGDKVFKAAVLAFLDRHGAQHLVR